MGFLSFLTALPWFSEFCDFVSGVPLPKHWRDRTGASTQKILLLWVFNDVFVVYGFSMQFLLFTVKILLSSTTSEGELQDFMVCAITGIPEWCFRMINPSWTGEIPVTGREGLEQLAQLCRNSGLIQSTQPSSLSKIIKKWLLKQLFQILLHLPK